MILGVDDGSGSYNPMTIAPIILRIGGKIATEDMSLTTTPNSITVFFGKS